MSLRKVSALVFTAGALAAASPSPAAATHIEDSVSRPVSITASSLELCALGSCVASPPINGFLGTLTLAWSGHSNGEPTHEAITNQSGTEHCKTGWNATGWSLTTQGGRLNVSLTFVSSTGQTVELAPGERTFGPDTKGFVACHKL